MKYSAGSLLLLVPIISALGHQPIQHDPLIIQLKPQNTPTRELVSLDGLWSFALAEGNSSSSPWTSTLPHGLECPVPASYNDIFVDRKIHDHVGWVYYQRQVKVPRGWSQERYLVRAEAATHQGQIYINDDLVAEHQGGYTPFEADVTDLVSAGGTFRLTIAVNNELTLQTIPPGRIEVTEGLGKRVQSYQHDFYNYAGLARSVWLYSVPKDQFIRDVTVVTDVEDGSGVLNYTVDVSDKTMGEVRISVLDETGAKVSSASGAQGEAVIEAVHLWQPGAAYLYQFVVSIIDASNEDAVIDTYTIPVGVRTIKIQGRQFLINDKPFYFTGFGRHEDTAVRGKGHDQAYMIHDFQL
ncbi:hypothetical protein N8T08_006365, partial [Aspergillus melleus]